MILSGHQPTYLPGIILFNKIALSDKFMFVGHCQASPGSWHNRNQIRGARLTVPIKNHFGVSINDTEFAGDHWKRKHIRSIELTYSNAPYFKNCFDEIRAIIELPLRLGEMNMELIKVICYWLDIKTEIIDGQVCRIRRHDDPNDMLIEMCRAVGADHYLSNQGSRAYVDENKLATHGITHCWQNFKHPFYNQGHPEFLTDLSIIDLLFNCGPQAGDIVRSCGAIA